MNLFYLVDKEKNIELIREKYQVINHLNRNYLPTYLQMMTFETILYFAFSLLCSAYWWIAKMDYQI